MAVTHYDLTATFTDLLGTAYSPTSAKVVAWIETNVGASEGIVDEVANSIALGGSRQTADSGGNVTWANLVGSDSTPADINLESGTLQYRVTAEYVDAITRRRKTWVSGWFSLTADIDLADVVAETYVPAAWMTTATATLQTYVDAGQAAATTASAAATTASGAADTAVNAAGLASEIALGDADAAFGAAQLNPASPLSVAQGDVLDDPTHPLTTALAATYGRGVSVKDPRFAATGDGTTDDTAAILAALAAAETVYFPPGTYRHTLLAINAASAARTLIGVPGKSILKASNVDAVDVQMVKFDNITDVVVDGLTFDGNASGLAGYKRAVQVYNCQRVKFTRCTWQNTRSIGILLSTNIQECSIDGCHFQNIAYTDTVLTNRWQAIAFDESVLGNSYRNAITNNTFKNIGLDCIAFQKQDDGIVSGNRCNRTGAGGVYVLDCKNSVISNNVITTGSGVADPYANGIDVIGISRATENITITGNVLHECSACGIGVFGNTKNVTITGNVCINNDLDSSGVKRAGIYIKGDGHTVTGNTCTDTQGVKTQDYGILVDTAATNIKIGTNQLAGNGIAPMGTVNSASDPTLVTGTYVATTDTVFQVACKAASTVRSNTATPADDADLTLTVEKNGIYEVEVELFYSAATTADLRVGWTLPASATILWGVTAAQINAASTDVASSNYNATNESGTVVIGGGGTGVTSRARVTGIFTCASTAGNLTLRWSQGTAEVSNTTIAAKSILKLRRIG